jgi:hypothetical protein
MNWIKVSEQKPPQGVVVETKLADPDRNEQKLKLNGRLWWLADGSMYVYYEPTHWRYVAE